MALPLALIIEDDVMLAEVYAEAAHTAGFEPQIIHDGQVAAEALQEKNTAVPALIVLDLHLPRVSGEELLFKIREDERLSQAYVIVASADSALASYLRSQADFVLEKPLGFVVLKEIFEKAMVRVRAAN